MSSTIDILIEVFTWIGFAGFLALAVVIVGVWAVDGTWLPAEAIVDREGGETVVRWYDAEGDANVAVADPSDAAVLAGCETASIWYRHGWRDRMRLTRRPVGLRRLVLAAGGMLALGVLCLIAGWVLYFAR